jgi:hypothetical protein
VDGTAEPVELGLVCAQCLNANERHGSLLTWPAESAIGCR